MLLQPSIITFRKDNIKRIITVHNSKVARAVSSLIAFSNIHDIKVI